MRRRTCIARATHRPTGSARASAPIVASAVAAAVPGAPTVAHGPDEAAVTGAGALALLGVAVAAAVHTRNVAEHDGAVRTKETVVTLASAVAATTVPRALDHVLVVGAHAWRSEGVSDGAEHSPPPRARTSVAGFSLPAGQAEAHAKRGIGVVLRADAVAEAIVGARRDAAVQARPAWCAGAQLGGDVAAAMGAAVRHAGLCRGGS